MDAQAFQEAIRHIRCMGEYDFRATFGDSMGPYLYAKLNRDFDRDVGQFICYLDNSMVILLFAEIERHIKQHMEKRPKRAPIERMNFLIATREVFITDVQTDQSCFECDSRLPNQYWNVFGEYCCSHSCAAWHVGKCDQLLQDEYDGVAPAAPQVPECNINQANHP